jgi:hypothetical protein
MRIAAGILMIIGTFIIFIEASILAEILQSQHIYIPVTLIPVFLTGIGGIFALKRIHYKWALVGAICSLLFPFFGIPALILLVKRKGEFQS